MKWVAAMIMAATIVATPSLARATPYVSCIDGHIVANLADCPPLRNDTKPAPAPIGGGPHGGGLLGGLLGGIL